MTLPQAEKPGSGAAERYKGVLSRWKEAIMVKCQNRFVVGILLCFVRRIFRMRTPTFAGIRYLQMRRPAISCLLGNHLAQMDWSGAVRYAVPIFSLLQRVFFVAQKVHFHFGKSEKIHWRQLVLLLEIVVLFAAGFFPDRNEPSRKCTDFFFPVQCRWTASGKLEETQWQRRCASET